MSQPIDVCRFKQQAQDFKARLDCSSSPDPTEASWRKIVVEFGLDVTVLDKIDLCRVGLYPTERAKAVADLQKAPLQ